MILVCELCMKPLDDTLHGFIVFDFLKDNPAICERCVFEKLTGRKVDWKE